MIRVQGAGEKQERDQDQAGWEVVFLGIYRRHEALTCPR